MIIAGSRDLTDYEIVRETMRRLIDEGLQVDEVISGSAPGADTLGERWAHEHDVSLVRFEADWETYKRRAGPMRNAKMAAYASEGEEGVLVAFPRASGSPGTESMIRAAKREGLEIHVVEVVIE